jgi:hypothetical protein
VAKELALGIAFCPASLLVEVEDNKYSGNNITGNSFDRRPGHVCAELIWLFTELEYVLE